MPFLVGYITPQDYGATGNGSTDDTAAIQAALNAVSSNGSTVFFPTGIYKISATLTASVTGTELVGNGWGSQILYDGSVATTAIAATGNIRLHMRDLRISQSNASHLGTALDISHCNGSVIERLLIDGGGGSGVAPLVGVQMNASTCHYNTVRNCRINYGGTAATGVSIIGASHGNTVQDIRLVPQGDDVNSSGVYIANTHSTTLIHPDVENAVGNGIWLDTAAGGTTIVNAYCELNNIGLKITSGVIAPVVLGGTFQSSVTANIQDNGAAGPVILNAWPNSGSNSYNHLALTNADLMTVNGVPLPGASFQPSDQNLLAWAYDSAAPTNSTALSTSGVLHLVKMNLRYAATVTNILYQVNTVGSGLTASQSFAGLYDSTGTLRGTSASLSTSWAATAGLYTTPLVTPYAAAAGAYYVAFVCNGTTGPALARLNGLAGASSTINAGLTAATYRFAINGTGNTTLPGSITLSSNTQEGVSYWAALS